MKILILLSVIFLVGCQCAPSGRIIPTYDGDDISDISFDEFIFGINCQNKIKH
jgi:hypothetical protein